MPNLFCYGCSFTSYSWPMYPEYLAQYFDKTFNCGLSGLGNFAIYHRLLGSVLENKIKKNDTVIVQWSEPSRHDYLDNEEEWSNMGGGLALQLAEAKMDHIISHTSSYLKTLTYMFHTVNLLESLSVNWTFLFLTPDAMAHLSIQRGKHIDLSGHNKRIAQNMTNKIIKHRHKFIELPLMHHFNHKDPVFMKNSAGTWWDDHPRPKSTYKFVKEILAPKLQINDTKFLTNYNRYVCNCIFQPIDKKTYNQELMLERMENLPEGFRHSYDISELINETIDMGI